LGQAKSEGIFISLNSLVRELRDKKGNKAAGEDGLGSTFIKEIEYAFAAPLAVLFRKSLDDGVVLVDWKVSNITPIYKKGPKQDPGNYRPVSLTSQVGKVMESVIN